jgi:lysophospholipase L1-like esterase
MNNIRVFILFSYILISPLPLFPEDPADSLKIACVGDSLTHGYGLLNRKKDSYPSQTAALLPRGWEIRNFGVNGACATAGHDDFYLNNDLEELVAWEADIIILMLGSNDSKDSIWETRSSYIKGIEKILNRIKGIKTRILLMTPPPCHINLFGIHNDRIQNEIIPALRHFSIKEGYPLLETGELFLDKEGIYLDNIHMNAKGYEILSRFLTESLREMTGSEGLNRG